MNIDLILIRTDSSHFIIIIPIIPTAFNKNRVNLVVIIGIVKNNRYFNQRQLQCFYYDGVTDYNVLIIIINKRRLIMIKN
jgi:hypothetical protein